jgi:hypothetical protein
MHPHAFASHPVMRRAPLKAVQKLPPCDRVVAARGLALARRAPVRGAVEVRQALDPRIY